MAPGPRIPRLAAEAPRTWLATGIGVLVGIVVGAVALLAADSVDTAVRATVVGTFVAVGGYSISYVLLTIGVFHRLDAAGLRQTLAASPGSSTALRRILNGEGGASWAILLSMIALVSVAVLGSNDDYARDPLLLAGSALIVAAAWAATAVAYALHYARLDARAIGFAFPREHVPTFADYVYLSVQVSTTLATSDVDVITTRMRRSSPCTASSLSPSTPSSSPCWSRC
ncbi:DUF1345 domain-containing protein [Microbacteriaceae bacterium VKM Ac-2854]|nr:DUF1345 domain-containing protein [Microbacteriaceae bacterium VKM Ac-2854]